MRQQRFGVQVFRSHTCNSPNRGKCQPELSPLLNPAWIGVWGCCAWRLWNRSSTAPQTEIVHRHRNTRADWDETKKTMCPSLESSRILKKNPWWSMCTFPEVFKSIQYTELFCSNSRSAEFTCLWERLSSDDLFCRLIVLDFVYKT